MSEKTLPSNRTSLNGPAEVPEATKTVKLNSRKSRFAQQAESKHTFEKQAEQTYNRMINRQEEIFGLGTKFMELMKDSTLPANKGPIEQSLEKEILSSLISFAVDLNNDYESEPREGMGSVGLLTLVFKTSLVMRDRYNALAYKVEILENKLRGLERQEVDFDKKSSAG